LVETTANKIEEMLLAGGHPALDFVNTLAGLRSTGPLPRDEHLHSYGDLLTFGLRTGTLSEEAAARLAREARLRPADAEAALGAALDLRALIEDAFRPLAEGDRPEEHLLGELRDADGAALRRAELVAAGAGYHWGWSADTRELEAPLWPLAHGAVELLKSESLERLKGCGRCRWLYLDLSKNRSRRWCSMAHCGTDAKVRSLRARRARARRRRARQE
jgi:predicted RNA-binding Zn ribbon-like protein